MQEKNSPIFYVEIVKHEDLRIEILLNFSNPDDVSVGLVRDEVIVQILQPQLFKSKETLKTL